MELPFLDFELPPELIAQEPCSSREQSRLLVVCRAHQSVAHRRFTDLPELLRQADLLVLNDTRVLPARVLGRRAQTGGKWEGLFLRETAEGFWEMLCQTRGRLRDGETILVDPGPLELVLLRRTEGGRWLAQPSEPVNAPTLLQRHGHVPLPPYIRGGKAAPDDRRRYQTVFARHDGAVAAPTAGLHFTESLFARLRERGVATAFVTLHVGYGTFQPLPEGDYEHHRLHREWCDLPAATVEAIERCRHARGRVVAVGTTTVRVLETVAAHGPLAPWTGETELFIRPTYPFRAVDALVTNFHLPRSSLLLLVQAFAGIELTRRAYQAAVDNRYRFFSYGDAMLIA